MPQVVKLPLAETDLDDLWWYIAQDNPDAADRFLDKIEESGKTIKDLPTLAKAMKQQGDDSQPQP